MNLSTKLVQRFSWMVLSSDGTLKPLTDEWGGSPLAHGADDFESKELALKALGRYTAGGAVSGSWFLVEKYESCIDWDVQ